MYICNHLTGNVQNESPFENVKTLKRKTLRLYLSTWVSIGLESKLGLVLELELRQACSELTRPRTNTAKSLA